MEKTREAFVQVIDGDYRFHFSLTELQAYKILNARPGDTVKLNDGNETMTINRNSTATHARNGSFDNFSIADLRAEMNRMTIGRAWDIECETDHWEVDD